MVLGQEGELSGKRACRAGMGSAVGISSMRACEGLGAVVTALQAWFTAPVLEDGSRGIPGAC